MIDHVYVALKQAGIVAFSKHDSYLVPKSQVAAAEAIVEAVFADLGYAAALKNKTAPTTTPTKTENWVVQLVQGATNLQPITQRFETQQAKMVGEQLKLLDLTRQLIS
jgi:hypothetical protein